MGLIEQQNDIGKRMAARRPVPDWSALAPGQLREPKVQAIIIEPMLAEESMGDIPNNLR